MSIFEPLMENKGTVSTALGKKLAKEALGGEAGIIDEAVCLCVFELSDANMRHVRAGAAKIVEIVAEKRPELVAPRLKDLFPALRAAEPQTRWMIIRIFGFCARLNESWAKKAIPFAEAYLGSSEEGLCLRSSADLFLGDYGALSPNNAAAAMPLLLRSAGSLVLNEEDWILEAFMKILPMADEGAKAKILGFAKRCERAPKKSTQARARRVLKMA
jgi:hypothetical protein